jgi:ribosomal protein L11 methyltransferase
MKKFTEFKVKFLPFNTDLVSGVLWNLEIDGIVENEEDISVFTDSANSEFGDNISSIMEDLVREGIIERYIISSSEVENQNWNEKWEKQLRVIEISENVVVKPSFRDYNNDKKKLVVEIDPKMSFGTGEHQTTKIMVGFIEKYLTGNERILDVGSGTAILSIVAVKLGAKSAIAFDIDEWSFLNGKENVERNGLSGIIDIRLGEIGTIPETNFDIVLANINTHIILSVQNELFAKVKKNGKLFLSGLLNSDEEKLINTFTEMGLTHIETKQIDDWSGLVFEKS